MSDGGPAPTRRSGDDGPGRRRTRRFMVVAFLVVPGAWAAVEAVWAATGRPAADVDHAAALMELSASLQPAGEDGWDLFVEAALESQQIIRALQIRTEQDGTYRPDFDRMLTNPADEARWRHEIDAIEQLRAAGVFDRLAAAAACPRAVRPLETGGEPLYHILLPELGAARNLTKARVGSMRLALLRGDPEDAVAAVGQSMAIARMLAAQSLLIDRLVSAAITQMVVGEVRRCLEEFELDAATAASMLEAIDAQRPFAPLLLQIEGERHGALDMIEQVFTDDGHGSGRLRLGEVDSVVGFGLGPATGPISAFAMTLHAGRAQTVDAVNAYFDDLVTVMSTPASARLAGGGLAGLALAPPSWRTWFSQMILPGVVNAVGSVDTAEQAIEALRVSLALEAYTARHGAPPASLEALVPELLAELPLDPVNGLPFAYRVDGAGRPQLISVGLDGVAGFEEDTPDGVASTSDDVMLNAPGRAAAQEE